MRGEPRDSDASETGDGQCNNTATTACDPNDLTKVFTIDACGLVTGVRDECSEGKICSQSTPTSLATCKVAPQCTGELTAATGCAGNDEGSIYGIDDCGDLVDVVVQTCDPGMVCQTVNATTAECVCDVSSDRVCNPDDPSAVYFLDTCGEIHSIQRSCPPSFVCGGDDPLNAECVAEVEECSPTLNKVCDADDLSAVFYLDSCGEPDRVFEQCGQGEACKLTPGNSTPHCYSTDQCVTTLEKICLETDLSAVFYVDSCGEIEGTFEECGAGEACKLTPGNSTPHCYSTDQCVTTLEKICLETDLSAVFYVDSCGEIEGTFEECGAGEACKLTPGNSTPHCYSTDQCVTTLEKICLETDLSAVFYVDSCGEIEGTFEECGAGEACKLTPGNSTPHCYSTDQCVTTLEKICLETDLSAVFYVNSCGEIEGTFEECGAGEACKLTPGNSTPHCYSTDQCVTTLEKTCLETDLSAVFYVDSCGEIEGTFEECGAGEACKLRPGSSTPHCYSTDQCTVSLDKICNPNDLSSIFYVNSCGELDGTFEDCNAGESCTIEPGNFTPQCRVPCWPTHTTIACSQDLRSTEWVNACGELTGEIITTCEADEECENNQCKTIQDPCAPAHASIACDPLDVSMTWWVNGCGEITSDVAADCAAQGLTCQNGQCVANCDQPIGTACRNNAPWFLTGESTIRETDSCGRVTDTVVETCAAGEFCTTRPGEPTCINSMTDTTSPYYLKACSFGMYVDAQTNLYMDCRCRKDHSSDPTSLNGSILNCWTVESAWGPGNLRQAAGPHLYTIEPLVLGGLISETHGEVFSAIQYTDPNYTGGGLVVAYNYETGDRRIVSGRYKDPVTGYVEYGSGYKSFRMVSGVPREETIHNYIFDIEMGNDGMLYTYGNGTLENVEIVRVNPTSGERTLVWRVEQTDGSVSPFGQCYGVAHNRHHSKRQNTCAV